mgnify:FL=1
MTDKEYIEKKRKEMKEEFTTDMHAELLDGEISSFDLHVMAAYAQMCKGISKSEALKNNRLTEQEYDSNIKRVLSE